MIDRQNGNVLEFCRLKGCTKDETLDGLSEVARLVVKESSSASKSYENIDKKKVKRANAR